MEGLRGRAGFVLVMAGRGFAAAAVVAGLLALAGWAVGLAFAGLAFAVLVAAPTVAAAVAAWPSRSRYRRYREGAVLSVDPTRFHVLRVLADGEKHGIEIASEVEERTGGDVRLGAGSFYGTIKRLLEDRLLEQVGEKRVPELGPSYGPQRYYRLTPQGRALVERETDRAARTGLLVGVR